MTAGRKFCWCIHTKCIPKCHHHSYRNQTRNATAKRRLNIHFCYVLINVYIGKKYIKKEDCYSTIPNNPIGDIWDTYSGKEKKTITLFIACCHCKESQTYLFLVFCHCKPKPSLPNRSKFQTHTRYIVLKDFITDHMQCKCHYTANEILIL